MDKAQKYPFHYSTTVMLPTTPEKAFEYLDDPKKLSSHMGKSSWMMAGSKMEMSVDSRGGRAVGSEITMAGSMMGMKLNLKEAITERTPAKSKSWETNGPQRLVIINQYRMGFELEPVGSGTQLNVFIDYSIPSGGFGKLAALLFARSYARWCTEMTASDARKYFEGKVAAS